MASALYAGQTTWLVTKRPVPSVEPRERKETRKEINPIGASISQNKDEDVSAMACALSVANR